jgi:hypothetical protein
LNAAPIKEIVTAMRYLLLPFTRRYVPYTGALPFGLAATLALLGTHDLLQTRHSLLRNYPIVGHIRFLLKLFGRRRH